MITRWKKLGEEPVYVGFRSFVRKTFRLPDGRTVDFDIKQEGRAVCVLALTAENHVVLAREYRPGPEEVLLELPGGGVEASESPEAAIRREMLEETSYGGDFQFVGTHFHCAYSTFIKTTFVARNCRPVQAPQNEANEFIEVVEMPLADFREHLRSGALTDVGSAYLALDFLGLL